ncbi:MAG TPA: PRC-barrel domain-containing protein, partial [Afifellaceae bacterium]|nr:PRC-barrel domain-containing protein [Afifellaceae bacterium]
AEGQPTIRVEQMDQQQAEQPEGGAALRSTDNPNAAAEGQEGEQQQAAATQGGDATANQPAGGQMQTIAASDIEGMEVVNAEGEQIGTAEGLVQSAQDNKLYLVINQGGFLGLGEKRVALSLDGMLLAGDRIVIPNVTDEQIAAFPAFEPNDQFPAVEGNMTADIRTAAQ